MTTDQRFRVGLPTIPQNTVIGNLGAGAGDGEPPYALNSTELAGIVNLGNGTLNAMTYYAPTDSGLDTAINKAITAAHNQGGGIVVVPNLGSTYTLTSSITIKSNVRLVGYGRPTLKLANNVLQTIIEGENFQTLHGTLTGANTCDSWSVENFILDGNYPTGDEIPDLNVGHGIAVYGRDFLVRNVYIKNVYRKAAFLEYTDGSNGGISPFNSKVEGLTVSFCGEEGLFTSVSDIHIDDINIRSASQNIDGSYDAFCIMAAAHVGAKVNIWRGGSETNSHRWSILIGSNADATRIAGAVLETGKSGNLYIGADNCQITARSYNCLGPVHAIVDGHSNNLDFSFFTGSLPGVATIGLQIGDDIAARSNIIKVVGSGTSSGLVNFYNSGGMNFVEGGIYFGGTDTLWTGTPAPLDDVKLSANASTVTDRRSIWKLPADTNNMVAFGTNASTATAIRHAVNKVVTNDNTGTNGVKLPNPISGQVHIITNYNDGASKTASLNVYPHSSGKFVNMTANAGVQIPVGATWIFINIGFDWAIIKSA